VERRGNTVRGADDGDAVPSSRYPTSTLLLAAIHRGDATAIRELFVLYAPLLRDQARSMNVPADERDEVVTTVLDDVVLHLMEHQLMPRHLARYLVAALRNRARNRHRNAERRLTTHDRASLRLAGGSERIVAECHSDYGLRIGMPGDAEASPPLSAAIMRLAQRSAAELTREETIMMIAIGRHMPLRDIAEQLGISYGAARVRLHRLRARFARLATQYVETLNADERREIERFFRRAQVRLSARGEGISGHHVGASHDAQLREKSNGQN
jgi:RNA polymerase sigma factor (sigma-70 family)